MRFIVLLFLTSCATFSQKPKPVGEPGPIACVGAQSAGGVLAAAGHLHAPSP